MKPQSAKAKGQRLMKEVKTILVQRFGLHDDDIRVTPSGVPGEDLSLSPLARSFLPFSVEGKNVEKLNIWDALEQSKGRQYPGLVIFSRNRADTYVALKLEDFLPLLSPQSCPQCDSRKIEAESGSCSSQ